MTSGSYPKNELEQRFTRQQIVFALRQSETGIPIPEITQKMGVSESTLCRWKKLYAGMGINKIRLLKHSAKINSGRFNSVISTGRIAR
jgi:hypothetical protein